MTQDMHANTSRAQVHMHSNSLMEVLNMIHMPFGCLKLVCLGNRRCCNRYFHVATYCD
jgi:hypothetical protein